MSTSGYLANTRNVEAIEPTIVGVFDHCTISVQPQGNHLKVIVEGATRLDTRVAWIPLLDDDEYDLGGDLKLC